MLFCIIPVRGRKLGCPKIFPVIITYYPRKGTETAFSNAVIVNLSVRRNISPQGDGNLACRGFGLGAGLTQHVPARGRKHNCGNGFVNIHSIIPARGRKLDCLHRFSSFTCIIPARGRKLLCNFI